MNPPPPTRRSPWPSAIIGYFVCAALFLGYFVVTAVRHHDDLVAPDYYEREVQFQTQLDSMNRSRDIVPGAAITFEPATQAIVIALPREKAQNATGIVELYRPSDARLDRQLPLAIDADGIQRLDARPLQGGLWKVRVKWNAKGQEYYLDQPVIVTSS